MLSSLPNLALYPVGALLRKSRDRGIHVCDFSLIYLKLMLCVAVARASPALWPAFDNNPSLGEGFNDYPPFRNNNSSVS